MNKLRTIVNDLFFTIKQRVILKFFIVLRDELYSVDIDNNKAKSAINNKAAVLVLGSSHYVEKVERFQIKSYLDLIKVLKLEQENSEEPFVFKVGSYDGKERVVKKAFLKKSALDKMPNAWFCVPESWLVTEQLDNQLVKVNYLGKSFVFLPDRYSNTFIEQSGFLQDLEAIYSSVGVPASTTCKEFDLKWLNRKVTSFTGLLGLYPSIIGLRSPLSNKNNTPLDWKLPSIAFGAVLLTYLVISQLYLNLTLSSEEQAYKENNKELTPIFSKIEKNTQNRNMAQVLASFDDREGWDVDAWLTIKPFLSENVKIFNVNFLVTNRISIRAQTSGVPASEILEELLQLENVKSAQFSGMVNKRKGTETFTIVIEVNDGE